MNKEFDFDKVSKRMPYTTPDGFFDQLEESVWKEVKEDFRKENTDDFRKGKTDKSLPSKEHPIRKPAKLHLIMRSIIAVAAVVTLAFIINLKFFTPAPTTDQDVEQAFCQLSTADQDYLLDIYQDDVFINE